MFTPLLDALRRFRHDERGNFFVLFGACALPLLLIMGGAVDLTRYTRYKTELSYAVDSASLALSRKHRDYTVEEAETFVTSQVASMLVQSGTVPTATPFTIEGKFTVEGFNVVKEENGFTVDAEATMDTIFLPLGNLAQVGGGVMEMDMDIGAEVVHQTNRLEVALVLDNTGSMNCVTTVTVTCANNWSAPPADSRIAALKTAATSLVNKLMQADMEDPDQIKIALVPFEGMVNVGYRSGPSAIPAEAWVTPPTWIEWGDQAKAHWSGMNFNKWNFTTNAACAVGATSSACKYVGPHFLYKKLNVAWEGCVEMRHGDYELSDDAPDTNLDSKYVPYFAPDEADSSTTVGSSGATRVNSDSNGAASGGTNYAAYYLNDYLNDKVAQTGSSGVPNLAQKYLQKYSSSPAWQPVTFGSTTPTRKDTTFPFEYGPNRGCPRPIVPLKNADSKATLTTAIDGMKAYWHSGTFIPVGLLWGWHVLSSTEPFTQGIAEDHEDFEDTIKAIVLLTDGDNQIQPGDVNLNNSHYSAYSYVNTLDTASARRLDSTASASEGTLDDKLEDLCEDVKTDGGVRLYTITFGSLSTAVQDMMEDCATVDGGQPLHYHAPTTAELDDIFDAIGDDLTNIHLAM